MNEELKKYIDESDIEKFISFVSQTQENGFGRVNLEVVIQRGNIEIVTVTKSESHKK